MRGAALLLSVLALAVPAFALVGPGRSRGDFALAAVVVVLLNAFGPSAWSRRNVARQSWSWCVAGQALHVLDQLGDVLWMYPFVWNGREFVEHGPPTSPLARTAR